MSDVLRIVHMLPALTKGGAERVAVDLANASARAGHRVTLVAGWKVDEQVLRVRLHPDICVIYMTETPVGKLQRYRAGFGWLQANRAWLAAQDVLHLHLTHAAVLGTILYTLRTLNRRTGPAIIETVHSVGMKIPNRARAFHAWNCRRRDAIAVMALDPFWRDFIDRNPGLIAELIPNGVDTPVGAAPTESVRAYLNEIGVPATAKRIIGTVGQFRSERQPKTIAGILINVLKQTPDDVHALMCGSGPELETVRALVHEAGMTARFTLPGTVNEPRLAMSAMSLFLTINVGEITGIAALEAAFCCTPLVGLQMNPNTPDDNTDWIWSTNDTLLLSKQIVRMLADPEYLSRIAQRQHNFAITNHAITNVYKRYVDLYDRTIKKMREE